MMKHVEILCLAIVLFLSACVPLDENYISIEPFSSGEIYTAISEYGAEKVIVYIFRNIKNRGAFLENISKGYEDWLELFPSLRNVSDAGWSSMMDSAIASALDINPRAALYAISQVDKPLDYVGEVCGETEEDWIEDKPIQVLASSAIKILTKRKKGIDNQSGPVADKCTDTIELKILWWEKAIKGALTWS